jgi:hypothetical protein
MDQTGKGLVEIMGVVEVEVALMEMGMEEEEGICRKPPPSRGCRSSQA